MENKIEKQMNKMNEQDEQYQKELKLMRDTCILLGRMREAEEQAKRNQQRNKEVTEMLRKLTKEYSKIIDKREKDS